VKIVPTGTVITAVILWTKGVSRVKLCPCYQDKVLWFRLPSCRKYPWDSSPFYRGITHFILGLVTITKKGVMMSNVFRVCGLDRINGVLYKLGFTCDLKETRAYHISQGWKREDLLFIRITDALIEALEKPFAERG